MIHLRWQDCDCALYRVWDRITSHYISYCADCLRRTRKKSHISITISTTSICDDSNYLSFIL